MSHRILLADDSLTIQKVVELTFSESEYELMTVGDGDRAVAALDSFKPDIVLADVVMPGFDGYTVCETVKSRPEGAFIPVILLTGTFERFDRARAERVGCDSIVTKPFDSHALANQVADLLRKAGAARAAHAAAPETTSHEEEMGWDVTPLEAEVFAPEPEPQPEPQPAAFPSFAASEPEPAPALPAEPEPVIEDEAMYATTSLKLPSAAELEALARRHEQEKAAAAAAQAALSAPVSEPMLELAEEQPVAPEPPAPVVPAGPEIPPAPRVLTVEDYERNLIVLPEEEEALAPAEAAAAVAEPEPLELELGGSFEAEPIIEPLAGFTMPEPVAAPMEEPAVELAPEAGSSVEAPPVELPAAAAEPPPITEPIVAPEPAVIEAAGSAIAPESVEASTVEPFAPAAEAEIEPVAVEEPPAEEPIPWDVPPEGEASAEQLREPEPEALLVAEPEPVAAEMAGSAEAAEPSAGEEEPLPFDTEPPAELEAEVFGAPALDLGAEREAREATEAAYASEEEEEIPERRDIEEDIAAYESSTRDEPRREVWEHFEAAAAAERAVEAGAEVSPPEPAGDLEALAATASLTDLKRLIPAAPAAAAAPYVLTDADVDRIARRVVELMSEKQVREIAWDVVPEMAERFVRERIEELEKV